MLLRKLLRLPGHKCLGASRRFETSCECGWHSCPHLERAEAYAEWREHARRHGAQLEPVEKALQRENREKAALRASIILGSEFRWDSRSATIRTIQEADSLEDADASR